MKFSLVIPTHSRVRYLNRLLKSVAQLDADDFEVVLVGNTREDSYVSRLSARYQKHFPIQSAVVGKAGVNRARNLGAQLSKGAIVVFIDDDCYFQKSQSKFLQQLKEFFAQNDSVDIVGGNYKLPSRKVPSAVKAYHIIAQNWFFQGLSLGPSNWCLFGGCLAVKRRVFDGGNWFEESITFGSAESEFVLRCLEKGFVVKSVPQISITHDSKITVKDIIRKAHSQSRTTSHFSVFSSPKYQLPLSLNFKDALLDEFANGPLERSKILHKMHAYEVNFAK